MKRDIMIGDILVVSNYSGSKSHRLVGKKVCVTRVNGHGTEAQCRFLAPNNTRNGSIWWLYAHELSVPCMFHGGEHEHS